MRIKRRFDRDLALVVAPSRATLMLDCTEARLYELLKTRELRSYKDGKSRRILVSSIHQYIERKLAEAMVTPRARAYGSTEEATPAIAAVDHVSAK